MRSTEQGILSDFSSTAVLFTPQGPLKGPAAMRPFFEAVFKEFGQAGTTFSMKHRSVDGDCAYIHWSAETADNVYEMGSDTLVVKDGQIVVQSFATHITPKTRDS